MTRPAGDLRPRSRPAGDWLGLSALLKYLAARHVAATHYRPYRIGPKKVLELAAGCAGDPLNHTRNVIFRVRETSSLVDITKKRLHGIVSFHYSSYNSVTPEIAYTKETMI